MRTDDSAHRISMIKDVGKSLISTLLSLGDNKAESGVTAQIQQFVNEIPGGFFIYKADGNLDILYANEALYNIFRCENRGQFEKLTGNSFKGMVYFEDYERVQKSIDEQIPLSHDALDYVEYRIPCFDGTIRWVEDYGHFVHTDEYGDIFYVFISDATEKILKSQAEKEALARATNENEQTLKNIIEAYDKERNIIYKEHLQRLEVIEGLSVNYESILYADLDTGEIIPYRLSEQLKRHFKEILQIRDYIWFTHDYVSAWVHADDKERVINSLSPKFIREKLQSNKTFYINFRNDYGDETAYMQLRIVNVGSENNHVSKIVMGSRRIDEEILQEIKQRKVLEDALTRAKAADIAKNTFLSNMSHDLRTPLNALFGYINLAEKNLNDQNAVKQYLSHIDDAGKQILDIVERVLELSYMESEEFDLRESNENISDILNASIKKYKSPAKRKDIKITSDFSNIKHSNVICDKDKIMQIVSHIVSNAVKYTKNGGHVNVSLEEFASPTDNIATYRIKISDDGIGISEKNLEKIFIPFERVSNTTASGEYGSGLGLTISKQLTERMGGSIEVESVQGKGSTFTVTLVLKLQDNSGGDVFSDTMLDARGKKLLLVDDNELNLEIETELLNDLGFIIDTAENGKIAVDMVQNSAPNEYAFILMDIQMPVMNGLEATKNIRNLAGHANIPIIALSANALESDKRTSLEAGIDAHLSKPLDVTMLLKTMTKLMSAKK